MTIRIVKHKPTTNVRDTVARVLQLIQRTNSWTQGQDLTQAKDGQGKVRSCFCLRGALRAAIAGHSGGADDPTYSGRALYHRASAAILKTITSDPKRYGNIAYTSDTLYSVVGFNDQADHKYVVRALRDTLTRLG